MAGGQGALKRFEAMNLCEYMCPGCYPKRAQTEPPDVGDAELENVEEPEREGGPEGDIGKGPTTQGLDGQVWPVQTGEKIRQVRVRSRHDILFLR
eukprot:6083446-Pyramimonas_sp.AAC.1